MSEVSMRDARAEDRDTVVEVAIAAYQQFEAVMQPHWEAYRQGIVNAYSDLEAAEQIIAVRDDAVAGSVLLFAAGSVQSLPNGEVHTRKWPEIRLLAVAPSMRGQGIGAALVQECMKRTRRAAADADAITLHTTEMMQVAMRMYERMGFVRDEELGFHPAPNFTIKGYRYPLDNGLDSPSPNAG